MKKLIIDNRMREIEKEVLKQQGYELIEIQESPDIYSEISSHVDIFTCKIGNKIIVEPSQYYLVNDKVREVYEVKEGRDNIDSEYPDDIKYNVCIIGKKAFHNFQYTDTEVKKELINQGYELVNTTQGYTNCSIAVIDDKSCIVTDKGLYQILQKHGIDVLFLEYEPDIKLLKRMEYSNKNGFIGGAISRIGNSVIITGDLKKIDRDGKIRQFINERNLEIIDFSGIDVIDYGGILEL
ncbi:MAG: hypothetical protein HFJ55_01440 [Clostridia bacterium]|nr:hypothetical protein [Clostridia bacterium]